MSIRKRTIKGVTYLYERISYRDEQGRPRNRDKLIGRIDDDGNLVQTRKASHKSSLQENDDTVLTESIATAKKPRRTKAVAEKKTSIVPCPDRLAVPTYPTFEHCISFHHEGKAYLQNLTITTDSLQFENGKMFFKGALEPISTVELQDMQTNESIDDIDIPLLTMYYTIILASFQEMLKHGWDFRIAANQITTVYAPDLMRCFDTLGDGSGINEEKIANIMRKTRAFHTIIGIHHIKRNGRPDKSYFPVMNFEGYDAETNTISFYSPYLSYIVREIFSASIKLDRKEQPRLKHNGRPMLYPSNSYLIKPSIIGERNKAAVENVRIIIQVIEQTGNEGTPHIKASTIVERNEALKQRFSRDKNPSRLLGRVFKKTWELLRSQTTLLENYDSIILPDPNDARNIPTPSNKNMLVFEFSHKGKKK